MIAIAALAVMETVAHSETTVDQWIALCSKGVSTSEHASCEAYARGVADAVLVIQATRQQVSTSCIPAGATANDLVKVALPFAQGQPPAARQLLAPTLLMDVFREAFPCPRLLGALFDFMEHARQSVSPIAVNRNATAFVYYTLMFRMFVAIYVMSSLFRVLRFLLRR